MKQKVRTAVLLGMIFLSATTFGQTREPERGKTTDGKKTAKTYLDLMVNMVSTSLNYGESNSAMADYKKSLNGIHAGASFQAGITPAFSLVSEIYFIRKGGKLKANNPLTTSESTLRLNTRKERLKRGRPNPRLHGSPPAARRVSGTRRRWRWPA